MDLGQIDLDTRFEYLVVYKNKKDNTLNTWTLGKSGLTINFKMMTENEDIEVLGIYQKLTDNQISRIIT